MLVTLQIFVFCTLSWSGYGFNHKPIHNSLRKASLKALYSSNLSEMFIDIDSAEMIGKFSTFIEVAKRSIWLKHLSTCEIKKDIIPGLHLVKGVGIGCSLDFIDKDDYAIRKLYRSLLTVIFEKLHTVLLGNPGTGKSAFFIYVIITLLLALNSPSPRLMSKRDLSYIMLPTRACLFTT